MATGLAIGGAVLAGGGQIYGGVQARKAAKKQAGLLEEQARLEREAAEFDAQQQERSFERLLGQQRLSFAASGVELEGSPLLVLEETLRDKEETIKNILATGAARARRLQAEAGLTRKRGRDMFISSLIGAASTGLKAGSQIAGAGGGAQGGSGGGGFAKAFAGGAA
jgi:hypothetical protein